MISILWNIPQVYTSWTMAELYQPHFEQNWSEWNTCLETLQMNTLYHVNTSDERISFKSSQNEYRPSKLKFIMHNASATTSYNKQKFCCGFNYAKRHLKSIRRINKWFDAIVCNCNNMHHCTDLMFIINK